MSVAERLKKLQRDHTKCLLAKLEECVPASFLSKAASQRSAGKRWAVFSPNCTAGSPPHFQSVPFGVLPVNIECVCTFASKRRVPCRCAVAPN